MRYCPVHNQPSLDQRLWSQDGRCAGDRRDRDDEGCYVDVRFRKEQKRRENKR